MASMMVPQLYKLWKTKRAQDLSLIFLFLYLTGTLLLFIYLYFEGATVAWICLAVEMGKCYLTPCVRNPEWQLHSHHRARHRMNVLECEQPAA